VLKDLELYNDGMLKLDTIAASDYLQTKPVGVYSMKDKAMNDVRATVHEVRATQELRVTFEEQVKVNTSSDPTAMNNSNLNSFARPTRDDRQSDLDRKVKAEVIAQSQEQLKISRTDPSAMTRRVQGGSSMKNKSESRLTIKQSIAKQTFLRDSAEEVVIKASNAELIAATRVTPANSAAIMKSSEMRLSSSKTLHVEAELRAAQSEELLLNPQLTRDARGSTSKTAAKAASTATINRSSSAVKKSTAGDRLSLNPPVLRAARGGRPSSDPKKSTVEQARSSIITTELPPDAPEIVIPAIDHRPPPFSNKSVAQYSNMTDNEITDLIDSNLNKLEL